MAKQLEGDRGERFGMPTIEGIGAIARELDCNRKSVLRRSRDRQDPLWILVDPFGKRYVFVAFLEAWVHRRTLSLQTLEKLEALEAKAEQSGASQPGHSGSPNRRPREANTGGRRSGGPPVPPSPMAKTNPQEARCK